VDGTNIRAHHHAAGASKTSKKNDPTNQMTSPRDTSRGGFGSKLHLLTDSNGIPLGALVTGGQAHESKSVEALMETVRSGRRKRPRALAGDKAYSVARMRGWLRRRRIHAGIPHRRNQSGEYLSKVLYKKRNTVERCINWLKNCRCVATRYDKLARSYLCFVKIAMIRRCLRVLDPSDTA
jgi:transposase